MSDLAAVPLTTALETRLPGALIAASDQLWRLSAASLAQAAEFLRVEPAARYDLLLMLTCVGDEIRYQLASTSARRRLELRVPSQPAPDSLAFIWPAANWLERQAYGEFGVEFRGHPNLCPLFSDDHPASCLSTGLLLLPRCSLPPRPFYLIGMPCTAT